jgi:hypothetical protein
MGGGTYEASPHGLLGGTLRPASFACRVWQPDVCTAPRSWARQGYRRSHSRSDTDLSDFDLSEHVRALRWDE